jgi:hypothetical protein
MQDVRPDYGIGPLNIDTMTILAENITVAGNVAGGRAVDGACLPCRHRRL